MISQKKSFEFLIICCTFLTVSVFLSAPAIAPTTGKVAITGNVPFVTYDITVSGIDWYDATITWKTNEIANSTVEYGTTPAYGSLSTDGTMVASHTMSLHGLSPGTLYHFVVISYDASGNRAVSADTTFITAAIPPIPTPTPVPGVIGGGVSSGGGGSPYSGGSNTYTGPSLLQPAATGQPQQPAPVFQPAGQYIQMFRDYPIGFIGLLYNWDDKKNLEVDISKAQQAGATITIFADRIEIYQHHSPGLLLTFWGDQFNITNQNIFGPVSKAEFMTDPMNTTMAFGNISCFVHAIPTRILQPSLINITVTVSSSIPLEVTEKIRNVSAQNNLELADIAYTMEVERINLPEPGAANVTMTLPASWVDQQGGPDLIHVARISEDTGEPELLNTVFVGQDLNNNMIFQGDSPNGTSLFAIFSVNQTAQQQPPQYPGINVVSLIPAAMIFIILLIVLFAIVAYRDWRQKKRT
jgi:hypothetical protein